MYEYLKKLSSIYALRMFIDRISDSKVLGIGTGSTVKYFIDELIRLGMLKDKKVVVSSYATHNYLYKHGIDAYTPINCNYADIYVDGLDEINANLDIIKGRGAALLWEKQLAIRSKLRIYIADYTKVNPEQYLYMKPVPIEVVPNAVYYVIEKLTILGYKPVLRIGKMKDGPIITDNGNFIIDLVYEKIQNAKQVDEEIKKINGVVETGLFPNNLVDYVIVSYPGNVVKVYSRR